jgi:cytochrome c2
MLKLFTTVRASLLGASLLAVSAVALHAETPLERGKYIVENVGMCADCHTPMVNGKPDMTKHLKGTTLGMQPIGEVPGWHKTSPDITGSGPVFARWKDEGMKKFLTTGLGPRGNPADPPMPAYKLKPEDADAVIAYLKSLK